MLHVSIQKAFPMLKSPKYFPGKIMGIRVAERSLQMTGFTVPIREKRLVLQNMIWI